MLFKSTVFFFYLHNIHSENLLHSFLQFPIGILFDVYKRKVQTTGGVTRALIGGVGWWGGGGGCHICFEMNLKTTDFKRNSSGRTRIYEYTPPPPN